MFYQSVVPEAKDEQIITVTEVQLKNGEEWSNVSLPYYLDISEKSTIRFKLNYAFKDRTAPSLIIQANHSFMDFYLDGEKIYGVEPQEQSLGNYFTNIPLPVQAQDSYMEIQITVPQKGLHRILIPQIYITDEAVHIKQQLKNDMPSLILNCLLFVVGFTMLVIAAVDRKGKSFYKIMMQGIAALNLAVYFMCETYIVVYIVDFSKLIYYFDMISFSTISVSMALLFSFEFGGKYKKILYIAAAGGIINTVTQFVLSIFGVIELRNGLGCTQIIQIISGLLILYCLVDDFYRSRKIKYIAIYSVVIIGGLLDILLFLNEMNGDHNVFFLKIGILIYMAQQVFLYVKEIIERIEVSTRENYYKHLALVDILTGCNSRLAYEIDKSEWSRAKALTVFSFDVNDLKKANDFFGHDEGDRLLKIFGSMLIGVFDEYGKCYRIGGDEFVVFCGDIQNELVDELLNKLNYRAGDVNNSCGVKIPVSYAVGVYSTVDTDGDIEKAIFLSDEQMYENKRLIKSKCRN